MFSIFPTTEHIPLSPPPAWSVPALTLTCILSILLPAGAFRLSSGAIVLGFFLYLLFWTREQTKESYILATTVISLVLRWLDLVAIHRPERDFWRVPRDGPAGSQKLAAAPEGPVNKLLWFSDLWVAQRGIGWNIEPTSSPKIPPKAYPRGKYIRDTALRLVRLYGGIDIMQHVLLFLRLDIPFFALPLSTQILIAWATAYHSYLSVEFAYYLGAILTIAPGVYAPRDWSPVTGSFKNDAYTVRKMWGTCWHQLLRRPCAEAGKFVKEAMGLKKGSFASRYEQIWVGFSVSAVMHQTGAMMGCFADGGYWQAVYFMVQPLGIMVEDLAIYLGEAAGVQGSIWTKRIGFLWVLLWFSWTLRFMVASQPYSWISSFSTPSLISYARELASQT